MSSYVYILDLWLLMLIQTCNQANSGVWIIFSQLITKILKVIWPSIHKSETDLCTKRKWEPRGRAGWLIFKHYKEQLISLWGLFSYYNLINNDVTDWISLDMRHLFDISLPVWCNTKDRSSEQSVLRSRLIQFALQLLLNVVTEFRLQV